MTIITEEEREGKSYGGAHLGNLGIVPAPVGVAAVTAGGYSASLVQGNIYTALYKHF